MMLVDANGVHTRRSKSAGLFDVEQPNSIKRKINN